MGEEVVKAIRNEKGQFVKGTVPNPTGRPKGSRNQANLVKEFITHALVNDLKEDAEEILAVAVRKAKEGDNGMIKLLLSDMLKTSGEEADDRSDLVIKVKNMTLTNEPDEKVIEHED